jgi:hypothetical protein
MTATARMATLEIAIILLALSLISAMDTSFPDPDNKMMNNGTFIYGLLSSQRKAVLFGEYEITFFREVANSSDASVNIVMH